MLLAATDYGHGVSPAGIDGSVVAVFAHAFEILCADGNLVTVTMRAGGAVPGGIVVAAPEGLEFGAAIAVGSGAAVRGGVLRIAGGDLAIDLREARPWRSRIGKLGLDLARRESRRAWQATRETLRQDGRAAPLIALARPALADLAVSSRELGVDAAIAAAARLIGLGDGVTPAGDDCLVGHLAGLWSCATVDAARTKFARELGRNVAAMAPRTHRASRAYLAAAADGEFSQRLADLVAAIAGGGAEATRSAAAAAVAVGHSSGACGVLGLLLGTAALARIDVESELLDPLAAEQSKASRAKKIGCRLAAAP